jgi:hypothetical protein
VRTVFECTECQYRYNAPWYEPTWLARTQFEPEHPQVHKLWETWTSKPETNPLAQHWMRTERERIIALLDNYTMYRFEKEWVIALIKGEEA